MIEVKISPEREGGFDRMALRISKFEEVESCYLMSGGYDLLVFVSGKTLKSVALFISERLATIEGVLSTATHFLLRPYKEQSHLLVQEGSSEEKTPRQRLTTREPGILRCQPCEGVAPLGDPRFFCHCFGNAPGHFAGDWGT